MPDNMWMVLGLGAVALWAFSRGNGADAAAPSGLAGLVGSAMSSTGVGPDLEAPIDPTSPTSIIVIDSWGDMREGPQQGVPASVAGDEDIGVLPAEARPATPRKTLLPFYPDAWWEGMWPGAARPPGAVQPPVVVQPPVAVQPPVVVQPPLAQEPAVITVVSKSGSLYNRAVPAPDPFWDPFIPAPPPQPRVRSAPAPDPFWDPFIPAPPPPPRPAATIEEKQITQRRQDYRMFLG